MNENSSINQEEHIPVGILKDGVCIDAAEFERLEDAQAFLLLGIWPSADAVAEIAEGYGIGDLFLDGVWTFGENRVCENEEPGA